MKIYLLTIQFNIVYALKQDSNSEICFEAYFFYVYLCSSRANWGLDFNNSYLDLTRATALNEHGFHCSPLLLQQIQNSEVSQEVKLRSLKAETTHKAGDEGVGTLSVIRVTKINTTSFITGLSLLCMQLHNTGTAVLKCPVLAFARDTHWSHKETWKKSIIFSCRAMTFCYLISKPCGKVLSLVLLTSD